MKEKEFAAYVGIDWADKKHDYVLHDVASGKTRHGTVEQTPEAMQCWLAELTQGYAGQRIAVGLEQARSALFSALMMYEMLVLYPVNPAALSSFRDALYPSHAKDDPVDADLIMRLVRDHGDRLRSWKPDSVATRTLRRLTEDRRCLVDERTALTNRLTVSLKESFPQALKWARRPPHRASVRLLGIVADVRCRAEGHQAAARQVLPTAPTRRDLGRGAGHADPCRGFGHAG